MSFLSKLHTPTGSIVISVILGIGLASLFRAACKGRNCVAKFAAPHDKVTSGAYQFVNGCYTYEMQPTKCTSDALVYK